MKTDLERTKERMAKVDIQLMLAGVQEDRKQELYEKYKVNGDREAIGLNPQRILIDNWLHNAELMLIRGATEEELNRVVEHIIVLIAARKLNLDVRKSYKDNNLLELSKKYLDSKYKKVIKKMSTDKNEKPIYMKEYEETPLETRKRLYEEAKERMEKLREKAQNMKDSGCTNEYIAEELMVPESTVRQLLKE